MTPRAPLLLALAPLALAAACRQAPVAPPPPPEPDAPPPPSAVGTAPPPLSFDFDGVTPGSLPPSWRTGQTKPSGEAAKWQVVVDAHAPSQPHALAMVAAFNESTGTYNLCWGAGMDFRDGALEVSVQAIAGEDDQGGGPMWRVQDEDNYYVCRWNPLEDNFRLYYVLAGARKQLASAEVDLDPSAWHTIRVEHRGDRIACWLDGKRLLEAVDAAIPAAGAVGVWTKADAQTAFDDLRVEPAQR